VSQDREQRGQIGGNEQGAGHVSFTRFTATLAGPVVIVTLYWPGAA
jgi:hypothetical protein